MVVAIDFARAADLRANQPSSSSLRVRAGKGAPGPSRLSFVGNRTLPSVLNGLYFCSVPRSGFCGLVLAGCSRRDQPKLFMLSLNDEDAMVARSFSGFVLERRSLFEDGRQLRLGLILCCEGSGVSLDGCLFAGRVSSGFVQRWRGPWEERASARLGASEARCGRRAESMCGRLGLDE